VRKSLNNKLLDGPGPGNGDQEKGERKCKTREPRGQGTKGLLQSAISYLRTSIYEFEREQCDSYHLERPKPACKPPNGIRFVQPASGSVREETNDEKGPKDHGPPNEIRNPKSEIRNLMASGLRPPTFMTKTAPDEIDAEEWDGPAVIILFVKRPLRAEMIDQENPEGREDKEREEAGTKKGKPLACFGASQVRCFSSRDGNHFGKNTERLTC